MSAIAGIIQHDGRPFERATLARMQNSLAPYGRDAQRLWQRGYAMLMHALLRTTPEDSYDAQPLADAQGRLVIAFDGRLDNREELAVELGIAREPAAAMADSDLVLAACLRWDSDAVLHMLGDFALAAWQPQAAKLWLARDPLGGRPLFWHRQAGFFAFASLPKILFALPDVPRALCEERLHDFICLLPTVGPESFFREVYRVEPGHVTTFEGGKVTSRRYHRFDTRREIRLARDADYVEALREQLDRAVACRLRACGPIASHLSSGYDSSTVTATAARLLAARGERLVAYTAVPREGFNGPVGTGRHADEGPGARALAARHANIEHVLVRPEGRTPLDFLHASIETMDRAPLNPCNQVWFENIEADAERRGVKVMLIAQMGNMSISYTGEQILPWLFGHGRWRAWWREAQATRRRRPGLRWRGLLAQSLGPYLPAPLWRGLQKLRGQDLVLDHYAAIHPAFMQRMDSTARIRASGWDMSYRPWADGRAMRVAALLRMDIGEHALASNARGLEMRDPSADLRLIEFCLALPYAQYQRDGQTRWLLHRLMDGVLPPEIVDAKTRGLQAADWYESIASALPRYREELAGLAAHGGVGDYVDLDAMAKELERWPDSGWDRPAVIQTYRLKLLRGIAVGNFVRYVDARNR